MQSFNLRSHCSSWDIVEMKDLLLIITQSISQPISSNWLHRVQAVLWNVFCYFYCTSVLRTSQLSETCVSKYLAFIWWERGNSNKSHIYHTALMLQLLRHGSPVANIFWLKSCRSFSYSSSFNKLSTLKKMSISNRNITNEVKYTNCIWVCQSYDICVVFHTCIWTIIN